MTARPTITCLGAGRMGRGIAVAFAYAGYATTMAPAGRRAGADPTSISGRNDNGFIPAFLPDQGRQAQLPSRFWQVNGWSIAESYWGWRCRLG